MITASQIRAARAFLGISAFELADLSGVSRRTIGTMESVDGVPEVNVKSLVMIQTALEPLASNSLARQVTGRASGSTVRQGVTPEPCRLVNILVALCLQDMGPSCQQSFASPSASANR